MTKLTTKKKRSQVWGMCEHVLIEYAHNPNGKEAVLAPFMRAALALSLPGGDERELLDEAHAAALTLHKSLGLPQIPKPSQTEEHWAYFVVSNAIEIADQYPAKPEVDAGEEVEVYDVTSAHDLRVQDPSRRWLVEGLWPAGGTGVIGGASKSAKTWLGLDIALSVASGTHCLDTMAVQTPGPVLYVSAEGGEEYVRERLENLCQRRGLDLEGLPHLLGVIPRQIRLDTTDGLRRLEATVMKHRPVLLILDPWVRLQRVDENSASSVSRVLNDLTALQQKFGCAIVLVHHTSKAGGANGSGQYRGSGDFSAWGDTNLVLKKKDKTFRLEVEHRAASAPEPMGLRFSDEPTVLELTGFDDAKDESRESKDDDLGGSIVAALAEHGPVSKTQLRRLVKGKGERILEALARLEERGVVAEHTKNSWGLVNGSGRAPVPHQAAVGA